MAKSQRRALRPVDLARPHGLSAQAIRNYEQDGVIPPARRTASGYRAYEERHLLAVTAFLALAKAYGHGPAGVIMRAVLAGDLETAYATIDAGHAELARDRETLTAVEATAEVLTVPTRRGAALPVGALAHRLGVTPATLRKWEEAGILVPVRDRGQRAYSPDDVRDADLAHLLRRGGYGLPHIATVLRQVRDAGGAASLAASLSDWRARLTDRGRAMLTAAARLAELLSVESRAAVVIRDQRG
ncbi:MerR family transcriptional regulator [Actinoplanes sp. SE50]|uniref:MerR family transcriptional regulator n=1 Tax=unclassified Actinoplanes TaxID=2626549 RepID=UPI00023ECA45|nr:MULTISPECIES: MerR family transcriptional regulator [unclassified Actinoplanes]AEV87695.1 HTH-type transcriptional regulator cueR [Actinoplanes sp. SE50/110]ATO86098.1 MerR family transcriptional regulator [Actinoplanes sp. SE50]SLM03512.1 MerR-family transcriptional regulator [Actinoplanes sp. SE50/110]